MKRTKPIKLETIDKNALVYLREDITKALKEIADSYGLKFDENFRIKYAAGYFRFTARINTEKVPFLYSPEYFAEELNKKYPQLVNKSFTTVSGDKYIIIGYDKRKRKAPILLRLVGSEKLYANSLFDTAMRLGQPELLPEKK